MSVFTSLRNHFIIAMPALSDPNFARSVTYICEHSPEGAMGIIINFPLTLDLGDILDNMKIQSKDHLINETRVLAGGPLQQERGFVIHQSSSTHWESSLELSNEISLTTSKDILEAIANHNGPQKAVVALGYSAWSAGQLEKEIAENSWLLTPASAEIIFETPHELRWHKAAALVGIDIDTISRDVGHS